MREFWITTGVLTNRLEVKCMNDQPILCDNLHVREVSPELDAAYAECERAFEEIKIVTGTSTKQWHIANDALAAIKKAREK